MWADQDTVGRNSNIQLENGNNTGYGTTLDFLDLISAGHDNVEMDSSGSQEAWDIISGMRLSEKVSRFIYSYYMLGKRIRDIAIEEKTTSQAVDQRHIQARKTVSIRLSARERWNNSRDNLNFKDIFEYDVCELYFGMCYPKKVVAKIMGRHIMAIAKIIDNKNTELLSL
jgi:hypothetical protein